MLHSTGDSTAWTPPVHDRKQDRADIPVYEHLREVFADCAYPQVEKLIRDIDRDIDNNRQALKLSLPLMRVLAIAWVIEFYERARRMISSAPYTPAPEGFSDLQSQLSHEIASGIISTWVTALMDAHAQNGHITPDDIAGEEIIGRIQNDLRDIPKIDYSTLLKAALLRFAEDADGTKLPHKLHLDQPLVIKAAALIP